MDFTYLNHLSNGLDKNKILRDLMEAYGEDVWNFAFSLTKQRNLSDDVRQDVFLKAYNKLETFRGESSVKTWLLSITRRVVMDYKKAAFLRKVMLVGFIDQKGKASSAEKEFLQSEHLKEVWNVVLNLPVKLREVLVLYTQHQLSIAEIANLLSISESAVKTRLHRARQNVNEAFQEKEVDHDDRSSL